MGQDLYFPPIHFSERAFERCGLIITPFVYTEALKDIWAGRSQFISEADLRRQIHRVKLGETFHFVIYDTTTKTLLTILHNSWVKENEDGTWELVQRYKAKVRRERAQYMTRKQKRKVPFAHEREE